MRRTNNVGTSSRMASSVPHLLMVFCLTIQASTVVGSRYVVGHTGRRGARSSSRTQSLRTLQDFGPIPEAPEFTDLIGSGEVGVAPNLAVNALTGGGGSQWKQRDSKGNGEDDGCYEDGSVSKSSKSKSKKKSTKGSPAPSMSESPTYAPSRSPSSAPSSSNAPSGSKSSKGSKSKKSKKSKKCGSASASADGPSPEEGGATIDGGDAGSVGGGTDGTEGGATGDGTQGGSIVDGTNSTGGDPNLSEPAPAPSNYQDTAGCPGEVFPSDYDDSPAPTRLVQATGTPLGLAALFQYPEGAFTPPAYIVDASQFNVSVGVEVNLKSVNANGSNSDITNDGYFNGDDVAAEITKLNEPMILYTGGCAAQAVTAGKEYVDANTRRLQDGENVTAYVVNAENWNCVSYDCNKNANPVTCQATCETVFQVWGPADVLDGTWSERISKAIEEFLPLMASTTVWYEPGQTISPNVTSTGDGAGGVETDTAKQEASTRPGPYIGAAAGTLAVLLLVVLLMRRNRGDDESTHLKLEDDGDETFVREFESDTTPKEYEGRDFHVVGEEDSIFSHWTGYSGKRKSGQAVEVAYNERLGHVSTDVHQCSSATCEVCEQRRQQGVSFVAAGRVPSRTPSLPSNASREYAAEDTIEL